MKMYSSKYAQFVIDYAVEWEKVVIDRVSKALKKQEQIQREVDHYQTKVESLRQTANQTMAKGKQVDPKSAERLTRNEEKLIKIKQAHNKFTSDLCLLIEEITDRSWRDLHPLLVKIAQFDVTLSADESKSMATLNSVVSELKRLAVNHGIKPQARLKDLDNLDPTLLSTKAPNETQLTIEAGMGGFRSSDPFSPGSTGLGSPLSGTDDMLFPPGSVAPQGMGGFPVAVQNAGDSNGGYGLGRSSSFDKSFDGCSLAGRSFDGSIQSAPRSGPPTTLDMVAITKASAPPPTMDSLEAAFGPSASSTTSGNQPMRGRKNSHDSDSGYSALSGLSAPPPVAAPPPPPGGGERPAPTSYGAPNPFGATPFPAPASAPNPFGAGPSPGAMAPYAGGPPPAYGIPHYAGAPPPAPASYFVPSPLMYGSNTAPPPSYGQQQPPSYGMPPPRPPANSGTNPFDN